MVIISASLRKTIDSIKEIVGNHSDSDIHNALKESNMDIGDAVHKLLHQDTFHEVKKRRDKKKEVTYNSGQVEVQKHNDYTNQRPKFYSDRNGRRGGYSRRDAAINREFRIVRDNRVNQSSAGETDSSTQVTSSSTSQRVSNVPERSAYMPSNNQMPSSGGQYFHNFNGGPIVRSKGAQEFNYNTKNQHVEGSTSAVTGTGSQVSVTKQNDSHLQSSNPLSSNVASASDPVHVPSLDSRSTAVGAIRREIGVVGGRRQSSEGGSKQSHPPDVSNINSVLGSSSETQSFRHTITASQKDESQGAAVESVMINTAGSRFGSHFSNRFTQQPAAQKGELPSKEWKPKTNQKPSVSTPTVVGSPVKSAAHKTGISENVERATDELQEKLTQVNIHDTQKVIIAQNIRVPEFDRFKLTFGTIGMESDSIENPSSAFQSADVIKEADDVEPVEASPSNNQINAFDDQVQTSAASSPSHDSSENPLSDNNDTDGPSDTRSYADMGLANNSSSFISKSEQLQWSIELPNFSAYDPRPVYDMPYFRPSVDDAVCVTGLLPNQEALSSHNANIVPNSSVTMMQQQTPMAQMYPPVHLSHYTNVMPYRQYMPPMYAPPMVPGYSGNPGYPHLSNGSSYVLMPGGGSHVPANGLKYEIQQFKPFPTGSPTGFGSLVNPTGYAMNVPGVVGGPTGLDDPSRLKYKDSNLYVPNPQAETSGVWIQNHREHPGMQSTPYFNMQGPAAHPAYMQSLTGHPSFNAVPSPQSSQMQFPGMYSPQPAGIPNGNIGVGVAPPPPGQQVGTYQQPQMNHLNWTTNF